jgi:IclR family transcriptional regulator, KDG regulon repressor
MHPFTIFFSVTSVSSVVIFSVHARCEMPAADFLLDTTGCFTIAIPDIEIELLYMQLCTYPKTRRRKPMDTKTDNLSSTEKALKILLAFTPYNHEMGTLELSKKLDIHKSTVSRLLHVLTTHGFLQQNPATKKYLLGRSAARIGDATVKSLNSTIVSTSQPYLNELSQKIGESVALEVLSGSEVILSGHVEGQKHIRFSFRLGELVPINVAAGAKAILAFCDDQKVNHFLKRKFVRFTDHTIVSKKAYLELLEEIRQTAIAYDRGERYEDSHAIATPIFNHEGHPVAAVVIAGPAFRMTSRFLEEAVAPLKKTASEISQRLFY